MNSLRYQLLHVHKHEFLFTATILSSYFASTAIPSFMPLVLHISILLFYSPHLYNGRSWLNTRTFALWITLSVSKSLHWLSPSLNALSTPFTSLLVLFAHGALTSFVNLFLVLLWTRSRTWFVSSDVQFRSSWMQTLFFPTLSATIWWTVAYLSPIGYFSSWSPLIGFPAYDWLIPIFGSPIRDWLVSAWAVVISGAAEAWYMGEESPEETPLLVQAPPLFSGNNSSNSTGPFVLGVVLLALTVPSYVSSGLPRPVSASDSTALAVGCALPHMGRNQHELTLEDYINESETMNTAHIILWPEGAVRFEDETERNQALAEVRKKITSAYVGVSFEEGYQSGGQSLKRTGLALVSKRSNDTHLLYYKRNLVPIAESYRFQKSYEHPPVAVIELGMRKNFPYPPKFRNITVTASICFDFAMPDPLVDLQSSILKPALVLGPARTWDLAVGATMWQQAKQRSLELGSMILWCDGGKGGVSGIVAPAQGIDEIMHIGEGSWIRTVGLKYPADDHQTLYARMGGSGLTIGIMWIVLSGGLSGRLIRVVPGLHVLPSLVSFRRGFARWMESRRENSIQGRNGPNLLMDE